MVFLALTNNPLKFFKKIKTFFKIPANRLKIATLIFGFFTTGLFLWFLKISLEMTVLTFVIFVTNCSYILDNNYFYAFLKILELALLWTSPVFLIVYMCLIWVRFFRKKYKKSFLLSFIPFSIVCSLLFLFVVLGCIGHGGFTTPF